MSEAVFLDTFLSQKIVSRNVEIRDRAVDALARKIQIGAVSVETISNKYIKVVGALLQWINQRQKEADFNRFVDVIDILKRIAKVDAGNSLLKRYQCVQFMQNFGKNCTEALSSHIEELIKLLVQKGQIEDSKRIENQENRNITNQGSFEASMDGTFDRGCFPFSETMHETVKPTHEENKYQTGFTFSNTVSFKESMKKQNHPVMHPSTLPSGGSISQKGVVKIPSSMPDTLEGCEMPVVYLCQSDAQALFDLSVNIKFGDISNIYRSSCCFEHQMLHDYPVEVFLQKGDVIKVGMSHIQSMLDALDGARGIFVNPIGFTPLLAFLNRLSSVHLNHASALSRPQILSSGTTTTAASYTSTLSKKIRADQKLSTTRSALKNDFLFWAYPCSDLDRWKDAASSRPKSSESVSSFDAAKLIILRSIQDLIDRQKIGIYSLLISNGLHVASNLPHSKQKMTNLLHQALDHFSDIIRHYGDQIFASAILRQILTLVLRVTDLALSDEIPLKSLMTQDGAIASTLERAIYHSIIFYPYVQKACTVLQEVNPDAVRRFLHCKSIGDALRDSQEYHRRVLASLPGGQLRIKSSDQFMEAADFFSKFIESLEMQSDDFPIQNVIPDLLNYSSILEAAKLDGLNSELKRFFRILMSSQHAQMKMRVIQRLKFKLRTTLELKQSGVSVPAGGYSQLASFLSNGQMLTALLDESLLTDQTSITEVGDLIVLIYHSLSPSERKDPTRFIAQMPLFQCLSMKNGQFKGLVSLTESVNDFCWLLRALRDLWSVRREQRMLASNTLINKIRVDRVSHYQEERDFLFEAFGPVEKIAYETHHSLLEDGDHLDFKGFDAENLLKMARSAYSEPSLKKTSMEQLTLLLSDPSVHFKQVLVEQKDSAFSMCTSTLHSAFSSIMGVEALDPHYLDYIAQVIRFLWRSFFRFPEHVSEWFSQFQADKQSEETMRVLESLQAALLKEHMPIRQNALKLLEVILFHSKHSREVDSKGTTIFLIPKVEKEAYHFIFKSVRFFHCQKLRLPEEEDPIIVSKRYSRLNPLFKIYLESQQTSLPSIQTKDERKRIEQDFLTQCRSRSCLGQLRESWDFLANYLLISWDHFDIEQIFVGLLEVLKILPISEQQGQFASDFIENMSSVFNLARYDFLSLISDNQAPLINFYKNFGNVITRHVLPFLFEVGVSSLTQLFHIDYLHNIFQLTITLLEGE